MKDERYLKGTFASVAGPQLDYRLWRPEGTPKGVVQFVHGMAEHIDRYDEAARAFNAAGYVVVGHSHLGHGPRGEIKGWFAAKNGWQCLIDDVHALRKRTQAHYPGLPYVLLGHSMGSFVVRCYLLQYAEGLAGAILSGTGFFPKPVVVAGMGLAGLICLCGGERKPSRLINDIAFGGGSKAFAPARTPFDWLSRDEAKVDEYVADPCCGFVFTAGGYRDMFSGMNRLTGKLTLPAELPVLFFSGEKDPVGSGNGVQKVSEAFRAAGVKDVTVKLYPDGRHEMFNETNREEVFRDVTAWIDSHI